jgi:hypothetical protein
MPQDSDLLRRNAFKLKSAKYANVNSDQASVKAVKGSMHDSASNQSKPIKA